MTCQSNRICLIILAALALAGCSGQAEQGNTGPADTGAAHTESTDNEATDKEQTASPEGANKSGMPGDASAANDNDEGAVPAATPGAGTERPSGSGPAFAEVSVHDPSVIRVDGTYYIYGSHLQSAKSDDLISWTLISSGVQDGNPLIPNVTEEMAEALAWGQTDTFWAGDVIELADGRFYMYYSVCKGDSPRAAIGLAVSDSPEGPFTDEGILLRSGMWGQPSEDGTIYDPTVHPNAIDPHTFYDREGLLWMVYGSYSGGIFILKLDPETGRPYPDQGYGVKLLGANHSRIEGPYILYSPDTEYYYLFLSYGGLDASGGYNIRVARSKSPDGPYVDAAGQPMIEAGGAPGSFFDDRAIEPYGAKLMGNYLMRRQPGEAGGGLGHGYVSPGHNSAYYDEETGRYYLIFHTRFPYRGEHHEVRTHQMFMNSDGWPVVAPHRYAGETLGEYTAAETAGEYKLIRHGRDISAELKEADLVRLTEGGAIEGELTGAWTLTDGHQAELTVAGTVYRGVFIRQWDAVAGAETLVFTALSEQGEAIWGSRTVPRE